LRGGWQLVYTLKEPLFLPKGAASTAWLTHFDNSPNNKFNPDPTKLLERDHHLQSIVRAGCRTYPTASQIRHTGGLRHQ